MTRTLSAALVLLSLAIACDEKRNENSRSADDEERRSAASSTGSEAAERPSLTAARRAMVDDQIAARGVRSEAVLAAMRSVPRHRFVPDAYARGAYSDRPLPIGDGQTISQPYIVGLMTELADVGPGDRVLEVGTGSGYQAGVLAELGCEVYSIEIVEALGLRARQILAELGYENVETRIGDGYAGWPEHAPFSAVVVTAAPPEIPQPLLDQLAEGGRLVAPVGVGYQELVVVTRTNTGYDRRTTIPVRFVPMTGRAQEGMTQ